MRVTPEELDQWIAIHRSLDAIAADEPEEARARSRPARQSAAGTSPSVIDDFNARASWEEILPEWTFGSIRGDTQPVRRPGKDGDGWSATVNLTTGRLYIFSTSTDLPVGKALSRFDVFKHQGRLDDKAAVKDLAAKGYGEPLKSLWGTGGHARDQRQRASRWLRTP